jgi:ribose-phosphate pyrophosphokinase
MKIFSGTSNRFLAEKIAQNLNLKLSGLEVFVFPDGEKRVRILDKVLDEDVVIVQSTSTPVDENYMQLFFSIDALRRNGAKSIVAVVPYLGYQRQDHMFREGEDVSVKVIAEILDKIGLNKLVAVDLHSVKIKEVFDIPVSDLSALPVFAEEIKKMGWNNGSATLVTPDMGGIRRIKILSEMLGDMPFAVIEKNRDLANGSVFAEKIEGKVGKTAIIVDDMISSGKTIAIASELLKKQGAEEIYVFATHAVFSEKAPQILQKAEVNTVYVTDAVFIPEEKKFPKLKILSVAEMISGELT